MCTIICMGNSYKNGGRCLAGIEVRRTDLGYNVVRNYDGSPKWIRPIMLNGNQGLPETMVGTFDIFDILDVKVINNVPMGAHSENVHFESIDRIGHYNGNISSLCDEYHSLIFGNRGKAVAEEVFSEGGYSLMFIRPTDIYIETQHDNYGREKYRIQFTYKNRRYDFPLTDPKYISMLKNGCRRSGDRSNEDIYLTLSLGVNYNEWHYKLVAGVIDINA